MIDEALLDRARQGDGHAFQQLVEHYQERIYQVAYDLTGDHHSAEDLSQEAFVRLYRSLGSFRGEAQVSSWLYRVTVNLYLDQRRLRWLRNTLLRDTMDDLPAPQDESDVSLDLERALRVLSPRERAVFVLRQYHGLRLTDIAADLQIAEGTVKALAFRALRKLRAALADYANGET